ncbi:hypothetical protein J6A31_06120 [bacterium]|nr:hypothetical protein [bacterium]
MNLTDYILPYPYEAYDHFHRSQESFKAYKDKIYNWVKKNTSVFSMKVNIAIAFDHIPDTEYHRTIKEWFVANSDKLKCINDFSGLGFGVRFDERLEKISVKHPMYIKDEDNVLYPSYDEAAFREMSLIDKLEWMKEHCEFIPFDTDCEYAIDDTVSHKFSHIKRDEQMMFMLKDYLDNIAFKPNDNVYYFIRYSCRTSSFYLERDLSLSPKRNRN